MSDPSAPKKPGVLQQMVEHNERMVALSLEAHRLANLPFDDRDAELLGAALLSTYPVERRT